MLGALNFTSSAYLLNTREIWFFKISKKGFLFFITLSGEEWMSKQPVCVKPSHN